MQVVPREKPMTVFQCIGYIYKNAGLKGFARGYLLCFGREPLAFATYFGSFELMTKWVLVYVTIYWEEKNINENGFEWWYFIFFYKMVICSLGGDW